MQVNNNPSGLQQSQRVTSVNGAQQQHRNLRADGNVIGQILPELQERSPSKPRFDVSDKAIAIVEEDAVRIEQQSEKYSAQQNQTAVSAYQQVDNIAKRESVQALFGVDVFA